MNTNTAQWESVMQAEDPSNHARGATKPMKRSGQGKDRVSPRLAVSVDEAARLLSVSRDHFERHIMLDLRIVRSGRRRLILVSELDRWLDHHATTAA